MFGVIAAMFFLTQTKPPAQKPSGIVTYRLSKGANVWPGSLAIGIVAAVIWVVLCGWFCVNAIGAIGRMKGWW